MRVRKALVDRNGIPDRRAIHRRSQTLILRLKSILATRFPGIFLPPQGEKGVQAAGHREYVGGLWDELGQLQLDMLCSKGLLPEHYLLDIACGSLRLGVKAISYLEPGHYMGVEKERSLVEAGMSQELGESLMREKKPEIIISSDFEFEKLSSRPDFAIAQSLFTHLTPDRISLCFQKLREQMKPASLFYATFFETPRKARNPARSHDRGYFAYTKAEMLAFGTDNGFRAKYLGDWNHPRNQVLVEYRIAPER